MLWTRQFWVATAERVIRTFAQAMLSFLGADAFNIVEVTWGEALGISAGAAFIALLTSIVASGVNQKGAPSFVRAENVVVVDKETAAQAAGADDTPPPSDESPAATPDDEAPVADGP